ncbi:hypothetical protein ACFQY4_03835 [Catellatospora bangladeshensis]|uniref:DUF4190 domain-containing protein n=1 Tax=Catellatospora bangladeshensis TaxID=310355 RepID=A0A8J3NHG6_9ACTN|nr:hypothetical protein [Catellatospora bangladeshensis]GIF79256.1 hypothetical protein Cba03nite_06050 [Catellatospora bangladeshensis]
MTNEPLPPYEPPSGPTPPSSAVPPPVTPPPSMPPLNPPPPPPPPGSPYEPAKGPGPGGRDNVQLYGIIGIVTAVACCGPLGILFGWLSMKEARERGGDQTLGKVGFWLGIAFTAISLLGALAWCAALAIGGSMSSNYHY